MTIKTSKHILTKRDKLTSTCRHCTYETSKHAVKSSHFDIGAG